MSKIFYFNDQDCNNFYKQLSTEILSINNVICINFLLEDLDYEVSVIKDFLFNKGISILEKEFEEKSLLTVVSPKPKFNLIFSFKDNKNITIQIEKTANIIEAINLAVDKLTLTMDSVNKKNTEEFFIIKDYLLKNEAYRSKSDKKLINVEYLKNVVLNVAKYTEEFINLINYLEKNELCKKKFFNNYNERNIFLHDTFIEMLSYFINYSEMGFTKYENKIGLFLDEDNRVILNFPYKDCFLLGGMDKEDDKINNEFMLNEVINKNSLERIFDRKAFTNFKNIGVTSLLEDGKESMNITELNSVETFDNQNLLIKGNNLIALHSLKSKYLNKIDVIYIDPPYYFNETKASDSFAYNSNFKLSTWLVFMKNRLEIAKQLLSETGTIFISIDEDGQDYLKILCDEIFGVNNYLGDIIWDKRNPKGNVKHLSILTENIIAYSKNKNNPLTFNKILNKKEGIEKLYKKRDELFRKFKKNNKTLEEINFEYRNYISKLDIKEGLKAYKFIDENGEIYQSVSLTAPGSKQFYEIKHPITNKVCKTETRGWGFKESELNKLIEKNLILFGKNETTVPRRKYLLKENESEIMTNLFSYAGSGMNDLENLDMDKYLFENPKPLKLLKYLLEHTNKNAIILDFFGGSGTTGHAVMDLNKEDGGNRKFIMIEQMDYIETITAERLKRAMVKYGYENNFIYMELKENKIREFKRALKNLLEEEDIEKANKDLINLIEDYFLEGYFIEEYNVIIEEINKKNSILEKLKLLFSKYIDHTMDYVNYADMENPTFEVSLMDKELNKLFYK